MMFVYFKKLRGSTGLAALVLVCSAIALPVAHADYPERPINGIVPFGVGGPSDVISRLVATFMSKDLGQPIIILNRPGAGGNIGMGSVANAKADGYNLLFTSIAVTQNPAVFRNMPYDPLKDLIAVASFGESSTLVAVSAEKIPAKTLGEFVALLKRSPPKTFNIAGAGGQRMTMEKFMLQFNVAMEQVNYRSGGDAAIALMSGDVHLQLNNATTLASGVRSGKIRLLAVAGESRLSAFPDVPTTAEAGFADYIEKAYVGLYAATATPKDIVAKLHGSVRKAVASPEVLQTLLTLDYVPSKMTQAEADAFYRNEIVRWKDVAKKGNIPFTD